MKLRNLLIAWAWMTCASSRRNNRKIATASHCALLDRAMVITRNHNDVKKMAIIVTASDGYAVVYSCHVHWLKSIEIR